MIESLNVPVVSHGNKSLQYAKPGDAGMDLRADEAVRLEPGEIRPVPTGVFMAIPEGYFGMVVPRSGAALNGLGVANSPGIVDSGYRGEIKVLSYNMSREPIQIHEGDRIAQIVFVSHAQASLHPTNSLPTSERGLGGFGSTGVN